jgi:uncharacterized membrane protein
VRSGADSYERREQLIAALLWYGTGLASAVIAAGIALAMLEKIGSAPGFALSGYDVVKAGVALFILLPIARVGLMLVIFLRERDYVYTVISALVLAIIGVGVLVAL